MMPNLKRIYHDKMGTNVINEIADVILPFVGILTVYLLLGMYDYE